MKDGLTTSFIISRKLIIWIILICILFACMNLLYILVLNVIYITLGLCFSIGIIVYISYLSWKYENKVKPLIEANLASKSYYENYYIHLLIMFYPILYLKTFFHEMGHALFIKSFHLQVLKIEIALVIPLTGATHFNYEIASSLALGLIYIAGSLTAVLVALMCLIPVSLAQIHRDLKLFLISLICIMLYFEIRFWSVDADILNSDAYLFFQEMTHLDKNLSRLVLDVIYKGFEIISLSVLLLFHDRNEFRRFNDIYPKFKVSLMEYARYDLLLEIYDK